MFFDIFHRRLPAVPGDYGHRPTTYLSGGTCSLGFQVKLGGGVFDTVASFHRGHARSRVFRALTGCYSYSLNLGRTDYNFALKIKSLEKKSTTCHKTLFFFEICHCTEWKGGLKLNQRETEIIAPDTCGAQLL